jgi:hypothetical protein
VVEEAPGETDRTDAIIRESFARFDLSALATASGAVLGGLWCVAGAGGVIGFCYGFVLGFAMGAILAFGWNVAHFMILMHARARYGHGGDL